MQEVHTILPIGTTVRNRYVVEDLLGKGGFGAVYLVRDLRVKGNLFALKEVIDPSKADRERFVFEGEVLRRLEHQALPRVYYAFENDKQNRAYILMDYIEGPNLETVRQQHPEKRFTLAQVMTIMGPIMDAVSFLHRQHPPIIHRDIKPANIIVPKGSHDTVLVDFGIAKEYDPDSTTTAIRRCSPGYGAPEQYGTGTNTRTDVYGLGGTMYALLTGIVPADALYRLTQLGSRKTDPLEPITDLVPDIPPLVAEAIHKAMAINSHERFASVAEFWQALNAYPAWQQSAVPALVPATPPPLPRPVVVQHNIANASTGSIDRQQPVSQIRKRRVLPLLLLLLVFLMGLALAAGYWAYTGGHRGVQSPTPTAGVSHTPVATATHPVKTSTPVPPTYPTLAPVYGGSIHNSPAGVDSTMKLTNVKQSGANISGNFIVGPELQGSGPFTGTVDMSNHIQFTAPSVYRHAPLFFRGTVRPDGSLSGDYCSLDSTNNCNPGAGGYGTWNDAPVSPGSGSFAPFDPYQGAHRDRKKG